MGGGRNVTRVVQGREEAGDGRFGSKAIGGVGSQQGPDEQRPLAFCLVSAGGTGNQQDSVTPETDGTPLPHAIAEGFSI